MSIQGEDGPLHEEVHRDQVDVRWQADVYRSGSEVSEIVTSMEHDGKGDEVKIGDDPWKLIYRILSAIPLVILPPNGWFVNKKSFVPEPLVLPPLPFAVNDRIIDVSDNNCGQDKYRKSVNASQRVLAAFIKEDGAVVRRLPARSPAGLYSTGALRLQLEALVSTALYQTGQFGVVRAIAFLPEQGSLFEVVDRNFQPLELPTRETGVAARLQVFRRWLLAGHSIKGTGRSPPSGLPTCP